jgi:demethylmenaquinone methyltransferase/2-methoxy-6-polyprenyl-1,4-benzoquinol methylase
MIDTPKALLTKFFGGTAKTYDRVVKYATFGRDDLWKNEIIKQIPNTSDILELACGTGILTWQIAQKFPRTRIVGVDITKSYLEIAKKKLGHFKNISFVCQDAETLELEQKFNCIVSSYIPKYCDHKILIPNCIRQLKSGGKIILHDFTFPQNRLVQFVWHLHFMILPIIGNLIPEWKQAFVGLPNLIQNSTWVIDYKKELQENGFDVTIKYMTWRSCAILSGTRNNI